MNGSDNPTCSPSGVLLSHSSPPQQVAVTTILNYNPNFHQAFLTHSCIDPPWRSSTSPSSTPPVSPLSALLFIFSLLLAPLPPPQNPPRPISPPLQVLYFSLLFLFPCPLYSSSSPITSPKTSWCLDPVRTISASPSTFWH